MTRSWDRSCLRLYLVTDNALSGGRALETLVDAAIRGGVCCVQLREKQLDTRSFLAAALALKKLLAPHRVPLIINDRVDIAIASGAHGVHLGQSDMPVQTARRMLAPGSLLGLSVETWEQVEQAGTLPVDYLGVSPIFATPTKTDTLAPWGLDGLRRIRAQTTLPLVAIGGINEHNATEVLRAGADGLAVVSAIIGAPDPGAAAARLRALCEDAGQPR